MKTRTVNVQELKDLGWQSNFAKPQLDYISITNDTRCIDAAESTPSVFFAYDGANFRAADMAAQALEKNAAVFISGDYKKEVESAAPKDAPVFFCQGNMNFQELAAKTISFLYGHPSSKIQCVGVTGTNGKTTIAWALYKLTSRIAPSMYIGTLGVHFAGEIINTGLTTPPAAEVQKYLAAGVEKGVLYAFIEVSSHAMEQNRLAGMRWTAGVFTNLTQDHLDYHKTMENYFTSKRKFFEDILVQSNGPGSIGSDSIKGVIINAGDEYGARLLNWLGEQNAPFRTIGLAFGKAADSPESKNNGLQNAFINNIVKDWSGYSAELSYEGRPVTIKTKLIGAFNLWNVSAVFLTLQFLLNDETRAAELTAQVDNVPGRMEHIPYNGANVFIDYAHTPDALEKSVNTILEMRPRKLTVVFGCGGDRDREKRPLMARAAGCESVAPKEVIITSDNPRTEDPVKIIDDIVKGARGPYKVILDRKEAIETALADLKTGEALLIAGKGHEDYQIIGRQKFPFSDARVVKDFINNLQTTPKKEIKL